RRCSSKAGSAECYIHCTQDITRTAMTAMTTNAGDRKPGRRPDPGKHLAILNATIALLLEVGYTGLTVERVAEQADVGKMTIYRHFPSRRFPPADPQPVKHALVIAALDTLSAEALLPENDDLRADLLALVRSWLDIERTDAGRLAVRLIGEAYGN